jgi:valyl-tRNA synthetase
MIKPYQQPIDSITFAKAIEMLENNLKVLHPFMPFLTEKSGSSRELVLKRH